MSISLMTEVWRLDFPRHIQSLMLALADHANDEGSNIYPSIRYLSWKTGYSERQVQRLIKILLKDGVLKIAIPATNLHPNQYQMNLSNCPKKPPFLRCDKKSPPSRGDKNQVGRVTDIKFWGDTVTSPKPPNETSVETPQPQLPITVEGNPILIYPESLSPMQIKEAEKKLKSIRSIEAQALIDELCGRMKLQTVKNPLGYLSALIKKYLQGHFVSELGVQVKESRDVLIDRAQIKLATEMKFMEQKVVDKSEPTKEFKQALEKLKMHKSTVITQ